MKASDQFEKKSKSQNIVQAQVILLNKQANQTLIELLASSLALFLTQQYLRTALHMYLPQARKGLEEQVF